MTGPGERSPLLRPCGVFSFFLYLAAGGKPLSLLCFRIEDFFFLFLLLISFRSIKEDLVGGKAYWFFPLLFSKGGLFFSFFLVVESARTMASSDPRAALALFFFLSVIYLLVSPWHWLILVEAIGITSAAPFFLFSFIWCRSDLLFPFSNPSPAP